MENLRFILSLIVGLMLVGLLGYWAFFTIEPGGVHAERQKQEELEEKNEELAREVEKLKNEIASMKALAEEEVQEEQPEEKIPDNTNNVPAKYQALANELQKLIDAKVLMKEKSRGSRVGTVQKFLNIYNNTSKMIDNDYGPGMKNDVMLFQKAEGLTADGEAGPGTFQKMIEWLKK